MLGTVSCFAARERFQSFSMRGAHHRWHWIGLIGALLVGFSPEVARADTRCVQIFYDEPSPSYVEGKTADIFLQNLLGHFSEFRVTSGPVEKYRGGQIEQCHANFYIRSFANNTLPKAFLVDFATTTQQFLWMGHSLNRLHPRRLEKVLGIRYFGVSSLDTSHTDVHGRPTFYRSFRYKGEVFHKFGEYDEDKRFLASFQTAVVSPETEILSMAIHNRDGAESRR